MMKTFLSDNKFSDKAIGGNKYLRDASIDVKAPGKLHAHINLSFTDNSLRKFAIHATVRLKKDAERLSMNIDENAVGRAIWVYSSKTYRSPQTLDWWNKNGNVTYSNLKKFCRDLTDEIIKWETEITKMGGELKENDKTAKKISMIGV